MRKGCWGEAGRNRKQKGNSPSWPRPPAFQSPSSAPFVGTGSSWQSRNVVCRPPAPAAQSPGQEVHWEPEGQELSNEQHTDVQNFSTCSFYAPAPDMGCLLCLKPTSYLGSCWYLLTGISVLEYPARIPQWHRPQMHLVASSLGPHVVV